MAKYIFLLQTVFSVEQAKKRMSSNSDEGMDRTQKYRVTIAVCNVSACQFVQNICTICPTGKTEYQLPMSMNVDISQEKLMKVTFVVEFRYEKAWEKGTRGRRDIFQHMFE